MTLPCPGAVPEPPWPCCCSRSWPWCWSAPPPRPWWWAQPEPRRSGCCCCPSCRSGRRAGASRPAGRWRGSRRRGSTAGSRERAAATAPFEAAMPAVEALLVVDPALPSPPAAVQAIALVRGEHGPALLAGIALLPQAGSPTVSPSPFQLSVPSQCLLFKDSLQVHRRRLDVDVRALGFPMKKIT